MKLALYEGNAYFPLSEDVLLKIGEEETIKGLTPFELHLLICAVIAEWRLKYEADHEDKEA